MRVDTLGNEGGTIRGWFFSSSSDELGEDDASRLRFCVEFRELDDAGLCCGEVLFVSSFRGADEGELGGGLSFEA